MPAGFRLGRLKQNNMKQLKETLYPIVILVLSVILAYQYGMNQAQSSLIRQLDCDRHYQDSVIINLLNNGK